MVHTSHIHGFHDIYRGDKPLAAIDEEGYFTTMIEAAEIERMSGMEKMEVMELLWRSMSAEPAKVSSPHWHKKILARRLSKVEAGKGEFLTLPQLKKRLVRRRT